MSAPGWYPDPSSSGGGYRYWDGTQWTSQTTDQSGSTSGTKSMQPWLWFGVAMVLVIGLVVFLIYRPGAGTTTVGSDTNSARPTGSQWDETLPSESPTQPENPEEGELVECPRTTGDDRSEVSRDGRLHGGGLSIVPPEGWYEEWTYMPGVVDHNSMMRPIVTGWISSISVAALQKSDFNDPQLAAQQMMSCVASSQLFSTFTGREDLFNDAFRLDGHQGWRVTANVYVHSPQEVEGDVVDIIVLETGDPEHLSIYVSAATIDLQDNLDEVARAMQTLRVEG